MWCCTAVVAAAAAAVVHRVPDGKNCCGFNESDSSVFFLSIQTRFILMYPLAVLSHSRPRFAYKISSVITGMRGAKAGVSPPRRSTPCKYMYKYVGHVISAIEKSDLDQVLSRKRPSSR